ncbi:hypothetical protein K4F52_000237 [Lecanicillium sp. MT-2017a]|nr:hypothetical protein K4F52_000237 [Lecanicillium sp. MT-2017a]
MDFKLPPSKYAALIVKGKKLQAAVETAISTSSALKPSTTIKNGYNLKIDPPEMPGVDDEMESLLQHAEQPLDGYSSASCSNIQEDGTEGAPFYFNYIRRTGKIIICVNNYAQNNAFYIVKEQHWFWSDMMATSYTKVVQPMDRLEAIWRYFIVNPTTKDLNIDILKRHKFQSTEDGNFLEIPSTSEDFHALLATDNRKGLCQSVFITQ